MQLRLRDHLAKLFSEQTKTSQKVYDSPRAMAKLFKEAGKVKTVLSANTEFTAQVCRVIDNTSFLQTLLSSSNVLLQKPNW